MRRVILAFVTTTAALVMLLSFKTHAASTVATPPAAVSTRTSGPSAAASGSSSGSGGGGSPTKSISLKKTVTGSAVNTRYGPVQVQITVKNGTVTAAKATEYPQSDPRDQQINDYAIPVLDREAVQAGNASINMVSGATYSSEGYAQSLQSALDKA